MFTKLIDHIKLNVPDLNRSEADIILKHFSSYHVKKKEFFLNQGTTCKYGGFVLKGCFRNYVTSSEGKEVHTI